MSTSVTHSPSSHTLNFRKDINGIRALAVLSVVLFHFYPQNFTGGFVGVDMFYVISGFLMTHIIVSRLETGAFRLRDFYAARAQRIGPALVVMCLVVLVYGYLNTTQALLYEISGDIAASLGFVSNFVYWQEAGYFDDQSIHKWLLHTWSLSVEWQFYLSYPLILLVLYRSCSLRYLRRTVLLLFLLSFGGSLWLSTTDPDSAFYLLPTRLWELLAGALLVLFPVVIKRATVTHGLLAMGVLLLVGSCFLIDNELPWPGLAALLPVSGVAIIIMANHQQSPLNLSVFQGLGKWSYSIYLWHWPIVVLNNYHPGFSLLPWQLDLFAWSILLGFASYHLVERPRRPRFMLALYSFTIVWALYLHSASIVSLPKLIDYTVYDQRYCDDINAAQDQTCRVYGDSQQLDFILWGDSHAINLTRFLGETRRYNFVSFAVPGCPPFNAVRRRDEGGGAVSCNQGINDLIFQKIKDTEVGHLILIARWSLYISGQIIDGEDTHFLCRANTDCSSQDASSPLQSFIELSYATLAELPADTRIIIMRGNPVLPQPGKYYLVGIGDTVSLQEHRIFQSQADEILDNLTRANIQLLDATPLLFDDNRELIIHQGNQFYYLDDNHLTYYGWKRIEQAFIPLLDRALDTAPRQEP